MRRLAAEGVNVRAVAVGLVVITIVAGLRRASRLLLWVGGIALAGYATFLALNFSNVAAGADSSGYLNSARLLASGQLTAPLRIPAEFDSEEILQRTKQPYRSPDSQSFFFDGKPLDYVAELMSAESIRKAGYFDPVAVGRLTEKCRQGRATGFADNQAFVGILSTMLVQHGLNGTASRSA